MEWKYVKPLTDGKSIANIEQKYDVEIPKYVKDIIIKYNGGRPLKNIFNTKNTEEIVFKSLLSYNKEDKENIYIYDKLFHKGYIPFAITEFGDAICVNIDNEFIELYLHELDKFEYVCDNIEKFLNILYN